MPRRENRAPGQLPGRAALPALVAGLLLVLGTARPVAAEEDKLRFDRAVEEVSTKPGATFGLPGGFTNGTGRTLDTVYLTVRLDRYLSFTEEFGNCRYAEDDETLQVDSMTCRLNGTIRPGRSYDLDLGAARVDSAAGGGRIFYGVSTGRGHAEPPQDARRGTGRTLTFTERGRPDRYVQPAAADPVLGVTTTVDVANPHDLAVNGVTLRGKPGDVVKADFFFVNNGPAGLWAVFDDEEDNEQATVVELTVPPGLTAVEVPDFCRGVQRGRTDKGAPGAARYTCWQDRLDKSRTMSPGQFEHFPFAFRVDNTAPIEVEVP